MKNSKVLILIVVLLVAIAAYFLVNNKAETVSNIEGAKTEFAIEDTASINKIFIADANGGQVTLNKVNKVWMVDGKYVARPDNIKLLMKTFSRIKVKTPVPKSALNNVIKSIATTGTKVEIYRGGNEPAKVYYVGGSTLNHMGTYMLLETEKVKSTVPFITYIPGFNGYLSTRFFTEGEQWRDAVVFKYLVEDVKSIKVEYFENQEQSFTIQKENGQFSLRDYKTNEPVVGASQKFVDQYVSLFGHVYYEMIDLESSQEKIDSILNSDPYFSIEVDGVLGGTNKIVTYHMPNYRQTPDGDGTIFEYDVDRLYAHLNGELFLFVQFATFDQITLPKSYLLK